MLTKTLAAALLCVSLTACSTSGDTHDLLLESAMACSSVCRNHPDLEWFSYSAGGGSPLLFAGEIAASCGCADEDR